MLNASSSILEFLGSPAISAEERFCRLPGFIYPSVTFLEAAAGR